MACLGAKRDTTLDNYLGGALAGSQRALFLSVWVRLQNRLVLGGFSGGSRWDLRCVFLGQEPV